MLFFHRAICLAHLVTELIQHAAIAHPCDNLLPSWKGKPLFSSLEILGAYWIHLN
jgi:hypothetical protein